MANIEEKLAREFVAAKGPVQAVLNKYWNVLHDIEYGLQEAAHEYDVAASYKGKAGEREAKATRDMINQVVKSLDQLSSKDFSKLFDMEKRFMQKFGTPEEYSDRTRREIFPR